MHGHILTFMKCPGIMVGEVGGCICPSVTSMYNMSETEIGKQRRGSAGPIYYRLLANRMSLLQAESLVRGAFVLVSLRWCPGVRERRGVYTHNQKLIVSMSQGSQQACKIFEHVLAEIEVPEEVGVNMRSVVCKSRPLTSEDDPGKAHHEPDVNYVPRNLTQRHALIQALKH